MAVRAVTKLTPPLPPNLTLSLILNLTLALTLTRQCGKTALGMARANGSADAAKRLLAAGAGEKGRRRELYGAETLIKRHAA